MLFEFIKNRNHKFILDFILLASSIFLIQSCGGSNGEIKEDKDIKNESLCFCAEVTPLGNLTDSITSNSESNFEAEGDINLGLNEKLKSIVQAELRGKASYKDYDINTRSLVNKVIDVAPEITKYEYYLWKIYCEYVKTICQSSDLTEQEVRNLKNQKLDEFSEEIKLIIRNQLGISIQESPKENSFKRETNHFRWVGISSAQFKKKLASNLNLTFVLDSNAEIGVKIKSTCKSYLNSESMIICSSAKLILSVNNEKCGASHDLPLKGENLTGNKSVINDFIEKQAIDYLHSASDNLIKQFTRCLD